MKVAIYVRTNENHEKITNKTAAQLFRLYTYAIDKGYDISLKHIYADTGSANTFPRSGVDNLLKDAKAKQFQKILVTGYDRLARSIPAMAEIDLLLERNNVSIEVAG